MFFAVVPSLLVEEFIKNVQKLLKIHAVLGESDTPVSNGLSWSSETP